MKSCSLIVTLWEHKVMLVGSWQMGSLGPYLLVSEVSQLLVPQSQDTGSFPGNLRVDMVIVGWALGELQGTQRDVTDYLTPTSPMNPKAGPGSP